LEKYSSKSTATIHVGNLSFNLGEKDLEEYFSKYGKVVDSYIVRRGGRPRGYGFVEFSSSKEADNALSANGDEMNGRVINIELAKGKIVKSNFQNDQPRNDNNGRFRNDNNTGFRNDNNSGFRNDNNTGFRNDNNGGFRNNNNGGFRKNNNGGFRNNNEERFNNNGGYRNNYDGEQRNNYNRGYRNNNRNDGDQRNNFDGEVRNNFDGEAKDGDQRNNFDGEVRNNYNGEVRNNYNRGYRNYNGGYRNNNWGRRNFDSDRDRQPRVFNRGGKNFYTLRLHGPKRNNNFGTRFNKTPDSEKEKSLTSVYVSNLPFSFDEKELANLFSEFKVKTAHIVTRGGRSKGFGFVEFETESDQDAAVKTKDQNVVKGSDGSERTISVKASLVEKQSGIEHVNESVNDGNETTNDAPNEGNGW